VASAAEAKHLGYPAETKDLTRRCTQPRGATAEESPLRVPQTQSAFHPHAQRNASSARCASAYDDAGNLIETHEHAGEFRRPQANVSHFGCLSPCCRLQTLIACIVACAARINYFNFTGKTKKRGRRRIRTAAYWREYYRLKQREWRAAHPRTKTPRKRRGG
jgi:hypothetical protein